MEGRAAAVSRRRGACLTAAVTVAAAASLTGASANGTRDHAAQAWNVLPPGQAGGVAFTKNSTDQIALYEGLTRAAGERHRRRPPTLLQARDARAGPRRARPQHRAATQGPHHHARPLGRAARQGRHGAGRGLRSRLGDRRRPAALDGALPRPRPDRRARRAGRRSVRPRALGAHVQAERPHGGDPRTTVRPAAGARRGGETGDPDRRRLRRRDQRAVPPSRSRAAPLDADGRRRRGRADRGGVRRGRRRRGAALAVPRRAPAKARRRERATRVGRPPPAKRSRGTRRGPLGGDDPRRTERDRERRRRRRAGYEPCAPGEPSDDVERAARRRRGARPPASRSSSPGRRSATSIPASCSSSISRAAGTRRAAWPSRASRSRSSWAVGSTTPGARRRPDPTSSTSTSRRSAGAATRSYLWNGECREMTTFDAGTIVGRPGEPDRPLIYRETVHGPVSGYATVDGRRVALSVKRSTRGRELASLPFFLELSRNEVRSAKDFVRAASRMELAFNWLYADHRDIAQFTSGRLPIRPATVDQGLPTKGTGEYEWRGFASPAAHAQAINPPSGMILNWNNKPSRAFPPADDEWTWGSVQRVDLLWSGIGSRREAHARERRRGDERRGDAGSSPPPRLAGRARGARAREPAPRAPPPRRRGSTSGSRPVAAGSTQTSTGRSTRAGAAVLDASLEPPRERRSRTRARPGAARRARHARRNRPAAQRERVERLQRLVVVRPQGSPRRFSVARCRGHSRRGSAASATSPPARRRSGRPWTRRRPSSRAAQGADSTAWRADATAERIRFAPGILPRTMRGSNKPTFQQAITFSTHR